MKKGNYIARSANNGISAFIGPNGRTLHKTELNKASTIVASLPMYKNKTIFSKYGNKVFVIIIFLYILLIFYFKKVEKNEEKNYLFTSESVSEGHPDKVCDRISDMVVDTYLAKEPFSRVACETLTTTNKVVLAGETRGTRNKKR